MFFIFLTFVAFSAGIGATTNEQEVRSFAEHMYYDCCTVGKQALESGGPTDAKICKELFLNVSNGNGIVSTNVENRELCGLIAGICCHRPLRNNNCKMIDSPETAILDPFQDFVDAGHQMQLECTAACNVASGSNNSITAPYHEYKRYSYSQWRSHTDRVVGFGDHASRAYGRCLINTGTKKSDPGYVDELNGCCAEGGNIFKQERKCGSEILNRKHRIISDFRHLVPRRICQKVALVCCNEMIRWFGCDDGPTIRNGGEQCNHDYRSGVGMRKAECCECCRVGQLIKSVNQTNTSPYQLMYGQRIFEFDFRCHNIVKSCYNDKPLI